MKSEHKAVMIIDDSALSRRFLISVLQEDFDILEFEGGHDALGYLRNAADDASLRVPDLIILDLMMPELDGYETFEAIRGLDVHIPILFITASPALAAYTSMSGQICSIVSLSL